MGEASGAWACPSICAATAFYPACACMSVLPTKVTQECVLVHIRATPALPTCRVQHFCVLSCTLFKLDFLCRVCYAALRCMRQHALQALILGLR